MPTAIITGANSGIGHALAKLVVQEGYKVIAADINVDGPINEIGCHQVIQVDLSSEDSIQRFKQEMGEQAIDVLVNVAGAMNPVETDTLTTVQHTDLVKIFSINTFGPFTLTQSLLPWLALSPHPRIAAISSRVGSIGDNSSGGAYSYRASKAALNCMFKNMAIDLKEKNIPVFVLHPGIVETPMANMGWEKGGYEDVPGKVEPDVAAKDLWRVLMSKGMESSGRFWHRSGEELPW